MTEDAEIYEPPDDIEPVSREEAKGMWRQLDAHRNGMWRLLKRMDALDGLAKDVRLLKVMVGVPCMLAMVVLLRALWLLSAHDAKALLAMVSP